MSTDASAAVAAGTALIAGASSGIGRSYARSLAAQGYNLVIAARRSGRLEELAAEIRKAHGREVEILLADLSSSEGLEKVKNRISAGSAADGGKSAAGSAPIDFFVFAAGFMTRGHFADLDESVVSSMVNLHCLGAAALTRSVLPGMIERNRGRIVLVSSLAAYLTTAEYAEYSATKAFLNTLAIGIRDELAATEVRIQSLCPGLMKTELFDAPTMKGFRYQSVPEKYWLDPETVVKESLHRLEHRYRPVLVPTTGAKVFLGILRAPIIGSLIQGAMGAATRKRVRAGKPAMY